MQLNKRLQRVKVKYNLDNETSNLFRILYKKGALNLGILYRPLVQFRSDRDKFKCLCCLKVGLLKQFNDLKEGLVD